MCPLPFDYFSNHLKYLTRPRLHQASWWRIHEVNNTHKVTRKPFPVISIGGDLQGSHNTICCPQCQRRWQTGIIYIGHCSCMSTCVYMCVYMCVYCQTSLHLTRSPRTSSSIFAYCKEWRGRNHQSHTEYCPWRNYFLTTSTMNTIFATNQGITCHLIYNEQWRQLFLKVTPENTFLFVLEAVEVFLQT